MTVSCEPRNPDRCPVPSPSVPSAIGWAVPETLPRVATEMALHVLAYNLTRVMNIMVCALIAAVRA